LFEIGVNLIRDRLIAAKAAKNPKRGVKRYGKSEVIGSGTIKKAKNQGIVPRAIFKETKSPEAEVLKNKY